MSLRKKIIFSFFISAAIITVLAVFEYVNFIQVRSEMRFLEVTDSARNRALQLRRHEKNFFLFPEQAAAEAASTRDYLDQLDGIADDVQKREPETADYLRDLVKKYRTEFDHIEQLLSEIDQGFGSMGNVITPSGVSSLISVDARDKPMYVAGFLQSQFSLPPDDPQVTRLVELDAEITDLRQTGEDITTAANELDRDARDKAEQGIRLSQTAILVFFPLFLVLGVGALLFISTGVVRRLKILTDAVDRIGMRYAPEPPAPVGNGKHLDEVDTLVEKFNNMNSQLVSWETELNEKNQELLQSKKLAAIGTLASGVAHELNNPLNNINISAQVLKRRISDSGSPEVNEIVDDIVGQTARVKDIVGNLLEFAREREPQLQEIELNQMARNAYALVSKTSDTDNISFTLDSNDEGVTLQADPTQLERVFVNLFTNAVAAMEGKGQLEVRIRPQDGEVKIQVSDTGKGISEEDRDKVFDPFFTKKDKGTGLGLAIVMNIIQKHSGHISVISEEEMGTIFEIILPKGSDR